LVRLSEALARMRFSEVVIIISEYQLLVII